MHEVNLSGKSLDIVKENVAKLKQLFPEIVTEDNIDFDKLKAVLGEYIEKDDESYRFTWYGKRDAFRKSQIPSTGTLRPCIEESKDWDTTQNLYIEGDNLEVLKLLQKSYNNKIKMIYIDPPYNKDKDFVYPDKWSDPIREYKKITGQLDDDGNVTSSETEDEGGRHTKWLNMMYPRLRLARNLLTDDGVIFISIDDDENANLKKLCDEVFGWENFVASSIWRSSDNSNNDAKQFSCDHNYTLIYSKEPLWQPNKISDESKQTHFKNPDNDPKGPWFDGNPLNSPNYREKLIYDIIAPNRYVIKSPKNGWRWSKETIEEKMLTGEIRFNDTQTNIKRRTYLCDTEGLPPSTLWIDLEQTGHNRQAKYELLKLIPEDVFDTPKPVKLIRFIIDLIKENEDAICLDFFSGSGTTAHAVMQANAGVNGRRKFILVQLPENLDDGLEKASNDKKTIIKNAISLCDKLNVPHSLSEIAKERIRRAGEKIKSDLKEKYDAYQQKQESILDDDAQAPMNPDDLDIGFKVFKLDNSNLKKWSVDVGEDFYKENKETQNAILSELLWPEVDNFIAGRTELDVVYEIMLKYGLDLTYPIETYDFNGTNIYSIGYGGLIVCLDTSIKVELADKIVDLIKELEPSMVRVAVRDLSFVSDSDKTNFKETLKNGVYAYFENSEDKADKQNQFSFITI